MASRRKQLNVVSVLDSSEAFTRAIDQSTKLLIVIDIHQAWTGPCTVMEPIYRKAIIELDRADERLKFYTIDQCLLKPEQRAGLPINDSCRPLFVVYKDKVAISKILGANAPVLEAIVFESVPPVPVSEEA